MKTKRKVGKRCQTCDYKFNSKECNKKPCGEGSTYSNWKPRQEEIWVEIENKQYEYDNRNFLMVDLGDSKNREKIYKLIPKGSTQKFKLVRVEEK
jgi:hypothetical protein